MPKKILMEIHSHTANLLHTYYDPERLCTYKTSKLTMGNMLVYA